MWRWRRWGGRPRDARAEDAEAKDGALPFTQQEASNAAARKWTPFSGVASCARGGNDGKGDGGGVNGAG